MSIVWLDHRLTVGRCLLGAGSHAVRQSGARLGLQRRAHRGGIGGVGCRFQQVLGGRLGIAECSLSRQIRWRTGWSVWWGQSGCVRGHLWGGVGRGVWGQVGGSEWGGIREAVWERLEGEVCGRVGGSRTGCVRRCRLVWIWANWLALGHVPHLVVPVQQLQGATHKKRRRDMNIKVGSRRRCLVQQYKSR